MIVRPIIKPNDLFLIFLFGFWYTYQVQTKKLWHKYHKPDKTNDSTNCKVSIKSQWLNAWRVCSSIFLRL